MSKVRLIAGIGIVLGSIGVAWASLRPNVEPPQAVASEDESRGDVDRLEGAWVRVSTDGVKARQTSILFVRKDAVPEGGIPARLVFDWKTGGEAGGSSNRVLLDPTKEPKSLDFFPEQEGAPKVCPGIYKREGDLLTICFRATQGERPSGFVEGKRGETLDVYRLVKP